MSQPAWVRASVGVLVVQLWKVLVLIAEKRVAHGITVVDVSSSQSRFRERFQSDTERVLSAAAAAMPRRTRELRHRLRTFARADIQNAFEYHSRARLLAISLDYADRHEDPDRSILDALVGFSVLDHFAARGVEVAWHDERVQRLKQRCIRIIAPRLASPPAT